MTCEYCLHDPCLPGCPNYEPELSGKVCVICGKPIGTNEFYIENYRGEPAHLDCIETRFQLLKWLEIPIKYGEGIDCD